MNILGRVTSPYGIHALAYRLNEGSLTPLSLGPTAFRLLAEGDFNVELDVEDLPGEKNRVELWVVDRAANESSTTVTVEMAKGKVWPLPCDVTWTDLADVQDAVHIVDGLWRLEEGGIRTAEIGYDRLAAIGDVTWGDYVVTMPITFHGFDDRPIARTWPSTGQAFGMALRWRGHYDWNDMYPRRGYAPVGALGMIRWNRETDDCRRAIGLTSLVQDGEAIEFAAGDTLMFKMSVRLQDKGPAVYSMKVWRDGTDEPSEWQVVGSNEGEELESGSMLLFAHHTDVTFGDVNVRVNE